MRKSNAARIRGGVTDVFGLRADVPAVTAGCRTRSRCGWMVSGMVLELISPAPLSPFLIVVAILPILAVGIVINYQRWRRSFAPAVPDAAETEEP